MSALEAPRLVRFGERRPDPLQVLRVPPDDTFCGLAFACSGSRIVAVTGGMADYGPDSERKLLVWDASTLAKLVEKPVPETTHLSALPGAGAVLLANASGTIRRVRLGNRARTVGFARHKGPRLRSMVVDRAGTCIFLGDANTRIERITLEDGTTRRVSEGFGPVISMAVSPDAGRLVLLNPEGLHILDSTFGTSVLHIRIKLDNEARVVWVDDLHIAFSCSDSFVHVVELRHGNGPTFRGHSDTVRVLASLGGGLVASAGDDGTVAVWSAADGSLVGNIGVHGHTVTALAFDPLTGRLASASDDGLVAVW